MPCRTTLAAVITLSVLGIAQAAAAPRDRCVHKAGEATGITRTFAEYEAQLMIRQLTGNWPIEVDRIEPAVYTCKQGTVLWTCRAQAKVCKR